MRNSKLSEFLSRNRFLIFLSAVFILVIILAATPRQKKTAVSDEARGVDIRKGVSSLPIERPQFGEVRVPGVPRPEVGVSGEIGVSVLKSAEKLPVFENSLIVDISVGKSWAKKFGFEGESEKYNETTFMWLSDGYHMFRYDLSNNAIDYQYIPRTEPTGEGFKGIETYENALKLFIRNTGIYTDPENLDYYSIKYLRSRGTEYSEVAYLEDADQVLFYIRPVLNGFPVVAAEQETAITTVTMDKYGQVRQLTHHLMPTEFKEKGDYSLIGSGSAVAEVQSGRGSVISVSDIGYEVPKVKSVDLTSGELVYLYPKPTEKYFQPVYIFSGVADASEEFIGSARVVVPAIDPKLLK